MVTCQQTHYQSGQSERLSQTLYVCNALKSAWLLHSNAVKRIHWRRRVSAQTGIDICGYDVWLLLSKAKTIIQHRTKKKNNSNTGRKIKKSFSKVVMTVRAPLSDTLLPFCRSVTKTWGSVSWKQHHSGKTLCFPSVFRERGLDLFLFLIPPWGSLRTRGGMLLLCFDRTAGHHVGNTLTEMALFGLRGQLTLFGMMARSSAVVASETKRRAGLNVTEANHHSTNTVFSTTLSHPPKTW